MRAILPAGAPSTKLTVPRVPSPFVTVSVSAMCGFCSCSVSTTPSKWMFWSYVVGSQRVMRRRGQCDCRERGKELPGSKANAAAESADARSCFH